jgi:hypothetical protein
VRANLRGGSLTALTALTRGYFPQWGQWEQLEHPRARAPTDSESTPKDQVPRSKMRGESIDLRLASQDATRYTREQGIRKIAEVRGRSYGFVYNLLKESGVELRAARKKAGV